MGSGAPIPSVAIACVALRGRLLRPPLLYHTILYYTITYHTILYYTIIYFGGSFPPGVEILTRGAGKLRNNTEKLQTARAQASKSNTSESIYLAEKLTTAGRRGPAMPGAPQSGRRTKGCHVIKKSEERIGECGVKERRLHENIEEIDKGNSPPCGGEVLHVCFQNVSHEAPEAPDVTPCRASPPMPLSSHRSRAKRPM